MRVIAGSAKGRRLEAPKGHRVRPTADRVKEALFSMLGSRTDLADAAVLDLFAGSGALGIEALSRGAAAVTFVEQDHGARRVLQANLARCGFADRAQVLAQPAQSALERLAVSGARFDGVVMDPPYGRQLADRALTAVAGVGLVQAGGWVAVEHHQDDHLAEVYGDLRLTTAKRYGKTIVSLFFGTHRGGDQAET
ncbi:MAG: 16S rRNA (guanine(966)-N(2))-methyltransferase RsmD [Candidatus Binatia bacterium]